MGLKEGVRKIGRMARILIGKEPKGSKEIKGSSVRNTSTLGKATPAIESINRGAEAEVSKVNTVFGALKVEEHKNGTRFIEMNDQNSQSFL